MKLHEISRGSSTRLGAWVVLIAALACVLLTPSREAFGQRPCDPQWLPGDGVSGVDGDVRATVLWDPDGAGPLTTKLVAGGAFRIAGSKSATNIAMYDLENASWSALGSGMSAVNGVTGSVIYALAVLPSGELVAGGNFAIAGGVAANNIARWNGTAWSALGSGLNGFVHALSILPNGDLLVGGRFTSAGAESANYIARWNGAAWSAFGSGMSSHVFALLTLPGGDVIAGGAFTAAGGVPAASIVRWNGTAWSALGPGFNGAVHAIINQPNGDIIAGGSFTTTGTRTVNRIARWDGLV